MNANKPVVLLVDNDIRPSFLNMQSALLIEEGYQVYTAESLERAEQLLHDTMIHLIIVDIRMSDEEDPEDVSGLLWAEKELYRPVPKIVLTAYPEEYVRETMDMVLDDKANIVGFVSKPDGPLKFKAKVKNAFSQKLHINWDLVIRWDPTFSPNHLISLIEPDISPTLVTERVKEFEDLLRQLFYKFTQVTLGRIISTAPGHVVLEAFSYNSNGQETQYVVSCGERWIIANENRRKMVIPQGGGKGSTRWASELTSVQTIRYAASGYYLVEGDLETMTSFSTFYRHHEVEVSMKALEHLYQVTLAPWYKDGLKHQQRTLPEFVPHLQMNRVVNGEQWVKGIESLCVQALVAGVARLDCTGNHLLLHLSDTAPSIFPLPTHELLSSLPAQQVLCGTIHGMIDGHNVRLDRQGVTWLINFTQAGDGELLRDFALLETHIKFDWLRAVPVKDRYWLEQCLLASKPIDDLDSPKGLSAMTVKAFKTITHLRQLAMRFLGPDLHSYILGLCAYSLDYFTFFDPTVRYRRGELERFTHAMISIAMLCGVLTSSARDSQQLPPEARTGLWVDEQNKCVWIEGQEILLTPQEYGLLAYLYQHNNQLCTRESIVQGGLGEPSYDPIDDKSRFDTAIARLRHKIEPFPNNPKYLITVRGRGYKLVR